jgi:hypothetical protein
MGRILLVGRAGDDGSSYGGYLPGGTGCYSATLPGPLVQNGDPGCYTGCYKVLHKVLHLRLEACRGGPD